MAENVPLTSAMDGREIETETEGAQNGYVTVMVLAFSRVRAHILI